MTDYHHLMRPNAAVEEGHKWMKLIIQIFHFVSPRIPYIPCYLHAHYFLSLNAWLPNFVNRRMAPHAKAVLWAPFEQHTNNLVPGSCASESHIPQPVPVPYYMHTYRSLGTYLQDLFTCTTAMIWLFSHLDTRTEVLLEETVHTIGYNIYHVSVLWIDGKCIVYIGAGE